MELRGASGPVQTRGIRFRDEPRLAGSVGGLGAGISLNRTDREGAVESSMPLRPSSPASRFPSSYVGVGFGIVVSPSPVQGLFYRGLPVRFDRRQSAACPT